MTEVSAFFLVVCIVCSSAVRVHGETPKAGSSFSWDHFTFTQFWPEAQCYFRKDVDGDGRGVKSPEYIRFNDDYCVPDAVTNWTIHGLWPSEGSEHKPGYCNSSWPFRESKIEDLKSAMMIHWPTYEEGEDPEEFWSHEWEKHGTCATSLPNLNSEHKYFATALALNGRIDLKSVLAKSNIIPSEKQDYKLQDILRALSEEYHAKVLIQCIQSGEKGQLLSVVEVCMDKKFHPIDCPNTRQECDDSTPVRYLPILRASAKSPPKNGILF